MFRTVAAVALTALVVTTSPLMGQASLPSPSPSEQNYDDTNRAIVLEEERARVEQQREIDENQLRTNLTPTVPRLPSLQTGPGASFHR